MVYTATQLVSDSYYASGVVSRQFATVSGTQLADGMQWLNDILGEKRVDEGMIPYESKFQFFATPGQETYFIPDLIQIDTLVFYLQSVRYVMVFQKRNQYFGTPRVQNIQSLPYEWYFERKVGGGNLHLYFLPDKNYPVEAHGIFNIPPVSMLQDLSSNITTADLGVPTFYGLGSLGPGQLVVTTPNDSGTPNQVDLMGNYPNIGALVNYINTGIIPGVTAGLSINDFVLSSTTNPPSPIYVRTSGYPNGTNFIGSVAAVLTSPINSAYNNGTNGIGATLTSNLNAALVVDGYTAQTGDRILVAYTSSFLYENGSYIVTNPGSGSTPWILTRTSNYDQAIQIGEGNLFTAVHGTVNAGLTFIQTADVSVIGTSPIIFSVFNALTFSNFSTITNPNYKIYNPLGFDSFFITYLKWRLVQLICGNYAYDVPVVALQELSKYEAWISKQSRLLDLSLQKVSTLQKQTTFNWGFVNIGRGWTGGG